MSYELWYSFAFFYVCYGRLGLAFWGLCAWKLAGFVSEKTPGRLVEGYLIRYSYCPRSPILTLFSFDRDEPIAPKRGASIQS